MVTREGGGRGSARIDGGDGTAEGGTQLERRSGGGRRIPLLYLLVLGSRCVRRAPRWRYCTKRGESEEVTDVGDKGQREELDDGRRGGDVGMQDMDPT